MGFFAELVTYSLSATMPLILYDMMFCWLHVSVEHHTLGLGYISITDICDWILENRPKCHTGPIPFYWPS